MKITPLDIRKKEFEKKIRGYDKDEVTAFLTSLSNEWERVLDENKGLTIKLKSTEKEVEKLREVESSLFRTLKTAEQTGANVVEQANKAAELHMKEIKMSAEAILNESKNKAQGLIEKAEARARKINETLQENIKYIEENYREIETLRQNAIHELKNLSISIIEKVERTTKNISTFDAESYVKRAKALISETNVSMAVSEEIRASSSSSRAAKQREAEKSKLSEKKIHKNIASQHIKDEESETKNKPEKNKKQDYSISFFDELETND